MQQQRSLSPRTPYLAVAWDMCMTNKLGLNSYETHTLPIAVCKIDTKVNPADIFTKYFPDGRAFKQLISQFMHDDMGSTIATAASTQTFTADALQSTMADRHAINSKRFIT